MSQTKTLHCPICRKAVALDSTDVPFCSDRCRLIDLGKWASGDYKITSPILDPDLLEDLEHAQQQQHPVGNPEAETKFWKN
ncbi:MAG: DNA gyrase inhibitor YacG [Acidobacteriaceae bacterium]